MRRIHAVLIGVVFLAFLYSSVAQGEVGGKLHGIGLVTEDVEPEPPATSAKEPCSAEHFKNETLGGKDPDNDGKITAADALLVMCCFNQIIEGDVPHSSCNIEYTDVDGSGHISPLDIVLIINYVNKHGCPAGNLTDIPACPKKDPVANLEMFVDQ